MNTYLSSLFFVAHLAILCTFFLTCIKTETPAYTTFRNKAAANKILRFHYEAYSCRTYAKFDARA